MELFEPMTLREESINVIKPEFLPNTAFINTPPKKLKDIFISRFNKFREIHGISKREFGLEFLAGPDNFVRFKSGDKDPYLSVAQRVLNECYLYDKAICEASDIPANLSRWKNYDVKKNFLKKYDLFCSRHRVPPSIVSEVFTGSSSFISLFRSGGSTMRLSTVDKVTKLMYEEDQALIEEMGEHYEIWISNKRK